MPSPSASLASVAASYALTCLVSAAGGWFMTSRAECTDSVSPRVIEVLRQQLERCGPEHLSGRVCPERPQLQRAGVSDLLQDLWLVLAGLFASGVGLGFYLWRLLESPVPVAIVPLNAPRWELNRKGIARQMCDC